MRWANPRNLIWQTLVVLHRYLGVAVGLLMVMWFMSGIVMLYVGLPRITDEARARTLEPIAWQACCRFPPRLAPDNIAIESIGGAVTSEALSSLALGGALITLGYSAGRKTTIDVTDLIWKGARMAGFSLFAQSPTAIATAWRDIIPPIVGGSVKPIVERVYPLGEAGEALRHLIEDRPFGKVVLRG
jgi:threonine dehydrogenase-like Zn-dependent dehydrogenase